MTSIIKVDNIQNSSGTDAISIDSNGNVFRPNLVSFRAMPSANINNQTSGIIIYGDVTKANWGVHNLGGGYSTTTGKFTAPVDGVYFFHWMGYAHGTNVGNANLGLNGSNMVASSYVNAGSNDDNYPTINMTALLKLSANDTIHAYVETGAIHANKDRSAFEGYLVG